MHKIVKFVYDNVYDLNRKKDYSGPYLYTAGGDLSKRWYVYYSCRNPETDKLVRQPPIDTGVNQEDTVVGRTKALKKLQRIVADELKNGYNVFKPETTEINVARQQVLTVEEAVKFVLAIKKRTYAESTYSGFKSRVKKFEIYLNAHGFKHKPITEVNKFVVVNFLNGVLAETSARNRNNTRADLSAFFTELASELIIEKNFFDEIAIKDTTPTRNKSYTDSQEDEILEYMRQNDPELYLYVLFISYNLLRPVEVNRLKVSDLDLKKHRLYVRSKTQPLKTKIIPEILFNELPDLSEINKNYYIFGYNGFGGRWDVIEKTRTTHYNKRFLIVKKHFGLGKEYGFYSFRHTAIGRLMENLLKEFTPMEAESRAMHVTGHTSSKGFRSYLREIDAKLPDDYSKWLQKTAA